MFDRTNRQSTVSVGITTSEGGQLSGNGSRNSNPFEYGIEQFRIVVTVSISAALLISPSSPVKTYV